MATSEPDPADAVRARLLRWWQRAALPVLGLVVAQFVLAWIPSSRQVPRVPLDPALKFSLLAVAICAALLILLLRKQVGGLLPTDVNLIVLAGFAPFWLRAGANAYFLHHDDTLLSMVRGWLWLGALAGVALVLFGGIGLRLAGVLEERGRVVR